MTRPIWLAALAIVLVAAACDRPDRVQTARADAAASPYAFDAPDAAYTLPAELDEISGLTLLDDRHLGAVQDEDGDLYVIDTDSARIVAVHDFGKDGDYEGVERIGDVVFVLRSDGRLYHIADWQVDKADADGFDTGLHGSCDAEGLATDGERLLIACKESPGRGRKGTRAIFAYDPVARALTPEPVYSVHADTLDTRRGEAGADAQLRELLRPIADINSFKPAALAVHPLSRELYVVSSVRKVIVVLSPNGMLSAVWPLPESLFRQPEGLAFLPDGTLFIANEAAGAQSTLLRFSFRPTP